MEKAYDLVDLYIDNGKLPQGRHNNATDAFRHALWNALNARDAGMKKAKRFGDAHEADKGQPDVEREMDLHNNEVGRRIGAANPDATDKELAELVLKALENNELIVSANPIQSPESGYAYGDYIGDFTSDLRRRLSINVMPFEIGMSYRDGYIGYSRGTFGKGTNTIETLPSWRSKE